VALRRRPAEEDQQAAAYVVRRVVWWREMRALGQREERERSARGIGLIWRRTRGGWESGDYDETQ
jgi:hypothetical protein